MSVKFFPGQDIIEITQNHLEQLRHDAAAAPLRRARLCLHRDFSDKVHEMVIAFCRDSYCRPHRHGNKSESFHIITGRLLVVLFDDAGNITRRIEMGPSDSGRTFFYRLNCGIWHCVVPLTEYVYMHETTAGPFVPGENEVAKWSPAEGEAEEIKVFLARITAGY